MEVLLTSWRTTRCVPRSPRKLYAASTPAYPATGPSRLPMRASTLLPVVYRATSSSPHAVVVCTARGSSRPAAPLCIQTTCQAREGGMTSSICPTWGVLALGASSSSTGTEISLTGCPRQSVHNHDTLSHLDMRPDKENPGKPGAAAPGILVAHDRERRARGSDAVAEPQCRIRMTCTRGTRAFAILCTPDERW